jgi:hypothetical protein
MSGRISRLEDLAGSYQEEHKTELSLEQAHCDDSSTIFGTKRACLEETKMPSVMIDSAFVPAFLGLGIVLFISLGWAWTMNNVAYDAAKWDMWREGVKMVCTAVLRGLFTIGCLFSFRRIAYSARTDYGRFYCSAYSTNCRMEAKN